MFTLPKTTYTFSQSSRGEGSDNEDVTIEFDTHGAHLDDLLEKFERFLKASGFCLDGMTIEAVNIDEDDHSHCNHGYDEDEHIEYNSSFNQPPSEPFSFPSNPYAYGASDVQMSFNFDEIKPK